MQSKLFLTAVFLGAMLFSSLAQAEVVTGRLDRVSFSEGLIEVDGTVYEVNTETTKVRLGSTSLSEEDLSRGDRVELLLDEPSDPSEKRVLRAVNILWAGKSGLES